MLFNPLYLLLSLVLLMKYVEETTSMPMENELHPAPVPLQPKDEECNDTLTQRDILFVVDGSGSVGEGNFSLVRQELQQLLTNFNIGPASTQVAVIQYGDATQTQIEFNLGEKNSLTAVNQSVDDITYLSSIKRDIGAALNKARQQVFNGQGGDRSTANNTMIIFVTGTPTDKDHLHEVQNLKDAGVKIITVGIGDENTLAELRPILTAWASVNSETEVLHFEAGFENLNELTSQLVMEAC